MDICPDFFKNFSLTNLNDLALHVTQNSVIIALRSLHTFIFRDSWQKMWGGVGEVSTLGFLPILAGQEGG